MAIEHVEARETLVTAGASIGPLLSVDSFVSSEVFLSAETLIANSAAERWRWCLWRRAQHGGWARCKTGYAYLPPHIHGHTQVKDIHKKVAKRVGGSVAVKLLWGIPARAFAGMIPCITSALPKVKVAQKQAWS